MNRSPYTDPSLNQPNPIIGSWGLDEWGVTSLIKYRTPLIGLPDVCLICRIRLQGSEWSDQTNLLSVTHSTEVTG